MLKKEKQSKRERESEKDCGTLMAFFLFEFKAIKFILNEKFIIIKCCVLMMNHLNGH